MTSLRQMTGLVEVTDYCRVTRKHISSVACVYIFTGFSVNRLYSTGPICCSIWYTATSGTVPAISPVWHFVILICVEWALIIIGTHSSAWSGSICSMRKYLFSSGFGWWLSHSWTSTAFCDGVVGKCVLSQVQLNQYGQTQMKMVTTVATFQIRWAIL